MATAGDDGAFGAARRRARSVGRVGEALAARYLRSLGFEILGRNVRVDRAEIDILARDADGLCVVEVKTRTDDRLGGPWEAVTSRKRRLLEEAARRWIAAHPDGPRDFRLGVAGVVLDLRARRGRVTWIDER